MGKKKREKPEIGYNMPFAFGDEEHLFLTPEDILRCAGKPFAFDVETAGLSWWRDRMICLGLYCPLAEGGPVAGVILTGTPALREACRENLYKISEVPGTVALAHNIKFDANFLGLELWKMPWQILDTAHMAHLDDSRQPKRLGECEKRYLGTDTKHIHLDKMPGGRKGMGQVRLGAVALYCINDCEITYLLAKHLQPVVNKLGLWNVLLEDMRYIGLLQRMERAGVPMDLEYMAHSHQFMKERLQQKERALWEGSTGGKPWNWRSHTLMSKILYQGMGIPKPANPYADADGVDRSRFADRDMYNKTMTNSFLLMEKAKHPLGALVAELREADKLLDVLELWYHLMDDGVLHTNLNPSRTRTYRLAAGEPNVQNMPSDVRGRAHTKAYSGDFQRQDEFKLRLAIKAPAGMVFDSTDYKQQEMRMFAILAKEPFMMESLRARRDIHADIAEAVWGLRDPVHREWSKTIAFGLIYGMTAGSLEHRLNTTREEAFRIADQYRAKFPRVMPFLKETIDFCKKHHYIRYWNGKYWREDEESYMYKGANALVQGGSAEMLKIAGLRCQDLLDGEFAGAGRLVIPVHDEWVFLLQEEALPEVAPRLAQLMECEDLFDLPFATEVKVGERYGAMVSYDKWLAGERKAANWLDDSWERPQEEVVEEEQEEIIAADV
jgi:DNA polymerase-1